MSSRLKIFAIIRNLLILIILSLLVISLFTCGEDNDVINPEKIKTAPAKLEIMMSPKVSIADIESVKLIVTGDNMDPIETKLLIDRNLGKATGSVNVPIGDNRVFQVEVYAKGNILRYIGQQKIDIRNATSVKIPVGIKPAEGVGVIVISEHIKSSGLAIAIGDVDVLLSKSPGNRRFVQNLAKYLGNAPRLKIDLSRGTAFPSQIIQELASVLQNAGFQAQTDDSFAYDRSKYDAILFGLPNKGFDLSQINAIQQFVQSGGMLILIADTGENLEPLNNLGNVFGFNFEYSLVNVTGGDPSSIILSNLSTLPLFDEVVAISSSYARSISIKPDPSGEIRIYNGATPGAGGIVTSDEPKLFISPSEANLGEILQSASFDIVNVGTGTLSWNIVKDPPLPSWLSISPESGKASAGERRNVTATVKRSGLDPGEYRHTVQVNSNAGEGKFLIIMKVPEPDPVLSFTPSSLNFGTTDTQRTLTITNNGGKTLDWQVSKGQTWLSVSPLNGSLASGKSQTVTVTVSRAGLGSGNYSDTISITSNGGNGSVSVSMSVPEPDPSLSISPTSIDFGTTKTQMTFNITNSGGGTLNWQASKQQLWLAISPTTGSLTAGKSQTVTLTVNRGDLKAGTYRDVVSVTTNVGSGNVNVTMTVPEPSPSLAFSPTSIDFGTTDTQKTLTITNKGGGTLNWQVTKGQAWLTLSPTSGTLTSGNSQNITLTVSRANLNPGSYKDTVSITSNGGNGSVAITMTVPEPSPSLAFSPTSIDFGITDTQKTLTITNKGGGTLNWQVTKGQAWLTLSPTSGTLTSGNSQNITLTVSRANLNPGSYKDTVSITSNGGNGSVAITMTVPEPSPSLAFSPTSIDFGTTDTQKTLTITNKGGGTLTWQVTKGQAWLTLSPTSGTLTSGNSQNITLTVSRANLNPGSYKDTVSITSNGGNGSVAITMSVPEPSPSLAFSPTSIDFGTTDTQKTLTITNKGGGTLNWQVTKGQAWLTLSPTSGTLTSGNSQNVTLTVSRANLNPGSYKDTVSITSNGGNGSVAITMSVPEPSPSLAFSPTSIDFGTTDTQKTLTITNKGGGTLNWQASNQQGWLTISPKSGSLSSGASQTVTLTVIRESTLAVVPQPGTYKDTITITSNGGSGTVNVTMTIPEPPPALSVSTDEINFGAVDTEFNLTISNNGGGTLTWQATKGQAWLTLIPTNGVLASGKSQTVLISVNRTGLNPDTYKDTINITSNGGTAPVNVVMTVALTTPVLAFSPSSLDFGTSETQKTLTITNNGAGTLSWQATRQQPWLTLSSSVGSLDAGKSVNITVTISRARLNPGSYKDTISITSNGGSGSIAVTMTVPEPAPLLSLSTKTLDFGSDGVQLTFNITNAGGGTLTWKASKQQPWLSLSSPSGSLGASASATITVKADRSAIKPGTQTDTIAITSNGGDGNIAVTLLMPGLSFSPTSLEFGLTDTQKTFTIKNIGAGILSWKASKKAVWLTLSSTSGTLGANASTTVTVTVSRDVSAGANTDVIALTSNGGSGNIPVSMPIPGLSFSPASFDFGASDTTKTLKISNIGGGTLNWKIEKRQAWITLNPSSGTTSGGASTDVQVTVSRTNLLPATYSDILVISSDGGSGSVPVNMAVAGFLVSPTTLDFGSIDTQKTLTITNNGGGPVSWQASKKESWLTVNPEKGTVDAGRSAFVTVTVSRTGLKPGSYTDTIAMTSNAGDRSVKVNIDVPGLSYTPTSIDFGSTATKINLNITNTGSGSLSWSLSKTKSWLSLSQTSGFNQAGETKTITVSANREGVSPGTNNDTITITSNGGNATIPVTMLVPGLGLSPTTLDFGSSDTQKTFTISNTGAGSLIWQATKSQAWLSFTPTSGTVAAGQSINVTVNVSRTDLSPGDYSDTISITYNGGSGSVSVKMGIPKLSFTPTLLDFGTSTNQKTFTITNSGGGVLTWQATKKANWLTITPTTGSVSAGQSINVTATVNRTDLAPGTYTDTIALTSNGGSGNIAVSMAIPGLAFSPTSLTFSGTETTKTLTITNSGGGTLTWSASKTQTWLSLSLTSGSLDAGKSVSITVTVTRGNLNPGTYKDTITIKTNVGDGQVPVTMLIASPSMSISPTSLDFGTTTTQKNFTITNTGGGTLTWFIDTGKLPNWLSANPMSGSLTAGNSANVTVTVNRAGMNSGDYKSKITVNSNAGVGQVSVIMSVPPPSLALNPDRLDFGSNKTLLEFRIINTGGGTLTWNAVSDRDWLFISRDPNQEEWKSEIKGGTTGPYGSTRIYVRVVRRELPGTYTGNISISSNGSPVSRGVVSVSMVISVEGVIPIE